MKLIPSSVLALVLTLLFASSSFAEANGNRLGLGVGLAEIKDSTYFAVEGEYEYRLDSFLGLGTSFNYVFSDPGFVLIAVPQGYLHPLKTDWYINAAPLFQFGGGLGTHVGVRLGTRLPISIDVVSIIPQFNIDFINGGRNLHFGLGIAI